MIFGREPVFWIGVIAAIAIAIVQTLFGQGLITQSTQDTIVNFVNALVPLLAALIARQFVTPVTK